MYEGYKRRKNVIFVAKIFDGKAENYDFNEPKKASWIYNHTSKDCERYKLEKRLEKRLGWLPSGHGEVTQLSNGYMVVLRVKRGTNLEKALLEEGFFEVTINEEESA